MSKVYRIYISEDKGYQLIKITKNENDIEIFRQKCLEYEFFVKLLVIRHDIELNMDEPYILEFYPEKGKKLILGGRK